MPTIPLEEPTSRRIPPRRFALFALGFRPFYLLGAAFAALAVPLWTLVLAGVLSPPLPGLWWHAHEMLFGFAAAVIVGFLFTAGRNWTGLPTPSGGWLAALAALWLAGRVALAVGSGVWVALIDLAFLPLAAGAFLRVLLKAGSRRNYFIGALPVLLALANLAFHLAALGVLALDPLVALHFALALIVLLTAIIGGRVIPMFTFNAVKARQWSNRRFDLAALVVTGVALALWAGGAGAWAAPLSMAAAAMQAARLAGWNPWATRRVPLLWVLHLAYLCLPLGLGLLAAAQWELVTHSAGIHALAIGTLGGLILGMITRTALGHTGRLLVAGRSETVAYALVLAAAAARVLTLTVLPAWYTAGLHFAAAAWTLAFVLYLWRYAPMLWYSRVDGRPG